MVDRSPLGKSVLRDLSVNETSEFKVKGSTRKCRRPEISPDIRKKIKNFQTEDISDSLVRKFLRQFEFEETEAAKMPKNGSRSKSRSPEKTKNTNTNIDEELEKAKKEREDFKKEIKDAIKASNVKIKNSNANSVEQMKQDQHRFMDKISEVIGSVQ